MQLIFESERISVEPNPKMSVFQAATSVENHLCGDPPSVEPANNMEEDGGGTIESVFFNNHTEVKANPDSISDGKDLLAAEFCIESDANSDKNIMANENKNEFEATTDKLKLIEGDKNDDTCETNCDATINSILEKNVKFGFEDRPANIEKEKVNGKTLDEDNIDDVSTETSSKIQDCENANEEEEEAMEHLELSDNEDDDDSKNRKNHCLNNFNDDKDCFNSETKTDKTNLSLESHGNEMEIPKDIDSDTTNVVVEEPVKENLLNESLGDAEEDDEPIDENILNESFKETGKDDKPLDEDILNDSLNDLKEKEEFRDWKFPVKSESEIETVAETHSEASKDVEGRDNQNYSFSRNRKIDNSDDEFKSSTDEVALNPSHRVKREIKKEELLEISIEDFINSTPEKEEPGITHMEFDGTHNNCEVETSTAELIPKQVDDNKCTATCLSVEDKFENLAQDSKSSNSDESGHKVNIIGNVSDAEVPEKIHKPLISTNVISLVSVSQSISSTESEDTPLHSNSVKISNASEMQAGHSDTTVYEKNDQASNFKESYDQTDNVITSSETAVKKSGSVEPDCSNNLSDVVITNKTVNENIACDESADKVLNDLIINKPCHVETVADKLVQDNCPNKLSDDGETTNKTVDDNNVHDVSADKAFNDLHIVKPCDVETVAEKPIQTKQNTDTEAVEGDESRDCVMVEDDDDNDDIMVIDFDSSDKVEANINKIAETIPENVTVSVEAGKECNKDDVKATDDDVMISADNSEKVPHTTEGKNGEDNSSMNSVTQEDAPKKKDEKTLVALDFLDTFKTKISDMTRGDLEEFCILKIVEGVIDRSNLSDIKAKLKTMMNNVDEWRKKAMVLNKQNRDLQIVLRTVQEEQKKRSDEIITPLKITRSVGMQVLMTENKTDPSTNRARGQKRPATNNANAATPKSTPGKTSQNKNSKTPIPVPRLVPALNSSPTKPSTPRASPQLQNSTVTSNTAKGNPTPNGMKSYTQNKPADKRPYSVSIDLTDDEPPPAKQMATGKGMQPPVRLVPSQQLMAPGHRSPLLQTKQTTSNPRQVYIPIGSPNIRPGQTIVFKTNQTNIRTRQPGPGTVVRGTGNIRPAVVRNQNKHPAPLPQAHQQPQPANWKALPPAPDLKISKIENGIVVSWKIDGYQEECFEEIVSYQLYAYQETSAPANTFLWNKIGDIKALPLPMACTLTQFIAGYKYYFAVRAVDARSRIGPFSLPGSILLLNK